jgi:hypothetical protein
MIFGWRREDCCKVVAGDKKGLFRDGALKPCSKHADLLPLIATKPAELLNNPGFTAAILATLERNAPVDVARCCKAGRWDRVDHDGLEQTF